MLGYWNLPEQTAEAVRDGWLHTGDIGEADADGYIRITDRKRDIIVNSGGDTLSPQRIEGFLALEPEIDQAMVIGDKRPYLSALVVPNAEAAEAWATEHGKAADLATLCDDADFRRHMDAVLKRVNARLSAIERVRRIALVATPFTTENGQLTPSMKIRRHIIRGEHGEKIEGMYH